MTRQLPLVLVCALIPFNAARAYSSGAGVEVSTQVGCGISGCHTGAAAPGVELAGEAKAKAGVANSYSVTITGGPGVVGGVAIEADNASLSDASGKLVNKGAKILTHSASARFVANALRFTFEVTPNGAGPIALRAAAASCDGLSNAEGDGAELKTLKVEVESDGVAVDAGSPNLESMDAGVMPPGGSAAEGYLSMSCQAAQGVPAPCTLLALVLLMRRRAAGPRSARPTKA